MKARQHRHRLFVRRDRSRSVDFHGCLSPVETFEFYAEAYHTAGRVLFERLPREVVRRFGSAPVVFLYRHSLELRLKEALISGQKLLRRQLQQALTEEDILQSRHNVSTLKNQVRDMYSQLGWTWDSLLRKCAAIIEDFHRVDARSDGFRYPSDMNCDSALPPGFAFDLRRFCKVMDVVLRRIGLISDEVYAHLDAMDVADYA